MDEGYLIYLDELRESGVTNMLGAAPYLVERFDLPMSAARDVLVHWMFAERHTEKGGDEDGDTQDEIGG